MPLAPMLKILLIEIIILCTRVCTLFNVYWNFILAINELLTYALLEHTLAWSKVLYKNIKQNLVTNKSDKFSTYYNYFSIN